MAVSIPQVVTEDRASGAQFIDGSLKFDGSSTHLDRTPSSASNRKTWTWSSWIKRTAFGGNERVFQSRDGSTGNQTFIQFRTDNKMYVGGNSDVFLVNTDRVFRDIGWGHLVVSFDTTQSTASNRIRIYWNGDLTDLSGTQPTQDYSTSQINNTLIHAIGNESGGNGENFEGSLSNVYLIDGQALGPENFGFTDPLTNTWRPKKYEGTFGTNGFWLPMDGNTPIGKDQSGRGNDWTPVNFGGSVALDNPQANGALPILNTTPGGVSASVGVRDDLYASDIVMAIPFLGNVNDISADIRGNGSNLSVTTSGSPAADSYPTQWYGSSFNVSTGNYIDTIGTTSTFAFLHQPEAAGTIEGWINTNAVNVQGPWFQTSNGTNEVGVMFRQNSTTNLAVQINRGVAGQPIVVDSSVTVALNTWYHWAYVKSADGYAQFFLNGVPTGDKVPISTAAGASNAASTNTSSSYAGRIARNHGETRGVGANISDYRAYTIQKYAFDTPFIPASTNPDILPDTPSGITGKTNLAKITEGAVSFDGSGSYLTLSPGTDFAFGTGDFTVECYVYSNNRGTYDYIIDGRTSGQTSGTWSLGYGYGGGNGRLEFASGSSTLLECPASLNPETNKWTHIAITRSGTSLRMFIDGVVATSATNSTNFSTAPGTSYIGTRYSKEHFWDGFISNIRVIKGTALYTSDFTPPTSPLTNVTNTKLLCCQSNTSATAAAVGSIDSLTGGGYQFTNAKAYSTYGGGARAANYSVQYSDDNSNWTTAWSGNMHNGSSCGLKQGTGSGNPGPHQYWRYVEGSATVGHHPRVSRIVLNDGTTDVNIRVYTSDNCSDSGDYQIGTTSTYTDSNYSAASTAKATKFNPFNTDINTVRGQETGYATLNPLDKGSSSTLSDGNLRFAGVSSAHRGVRATIKPTVKIYAEMIISHNETGIGFASSFVGLDNSTLVNGKWVVYNNQLRSNGSSIASITTLGAGEIIQVAYDPVTTASWIGRNNKWYDSSGTFTGNPATGANPTFYIPDAFIYVHSYNAYVVNANFGQKPFKFPPPDGFQPLSFSNTQPENVITRPDQYVQANIWSGDNTTRNFNIGMKPDFVWIKCRSDAAGHRIFDSVRGPRNSLRTSSTDGQDTVSNFGYVSSFNNNGFTLTPGGYSGYESGDVNMTGRTYVGWTWKAGGSKGTFNIDDVGYANASDVNMSVGGLNSLIYNDDQVWSSGLSGSGSGGGWASNEGPTVAFDGDTDTRARWTGTSSGVITASFTAISATKLRVKGHFFKNNTVANEDVMISVNGGTYVVPTDLGLTTYEEIQAAPGQNLFIDFSSLITGGQVSSVSIKRRGSVSSASGLTIHAIEVDGKILVDSNQTPPNAPSIAATGCSVGTKQGFSIVKFDGNSTTTGTIPHGLNKKPQFVIVKDLVNNDDWQIKFVDENRYLKLNATDTGSTSYSNYTATDSVIKLGYTWNNDSSSHIAYCWHEVSGLQKFGIYEGNTTEGAFVELGFRPAIIWIKSIDQTWYWNIHDSKRSPINPGEGNFLRPDQNYVEGTASGNNNIDFLSNGFKIRSTTAQSEPTNVNGQTYFYAAWAEAPSINLYGAQANAR